MLFNCLLPQLFWFRRLRVNQPVIVLICLGVVVGMWLERYEIVVTSLHRPQLPSAWGIYHGTFWDWATLFGTVGMFLSGILLSVRYVPIVSMHEMRTLIAAQRTPAAVAGTLHDRCARGVRVARSAARCARALGGGAGEGRSRPTRRCRWTKTRRFAVAARDVRRRNAGFRRLLC